MQLTLLAFPFWRLGNGIQMPALLLQRRKRIQTDDCFVTDAADSGCGGLVDAAGRLRLLHKG